MITDVDDKDDYDLCGWNNKPTRDFWCYLVSYRSNKPLWAAMYDAAKENDRLSVVELAADSLSVNSGRPIEDARASLESVVWDSIEAEILDLGRDGMFGE